jgi:tRNA(Ile2) C34 agmatinyltransferase TiaS
MTAEPWRWRCPAGHTSWESARDGYRCRMCEERFSELVDAREV